MFTQMKKIVFMGTSDFAVPILNRILGMDSVAKVLAIYTASGKEKKNKESVQSVAKKNNIMLYMPHRISDCDIQNLHACDPDIIIVASYGLILRQNVLSIPKYGCINVHPSALPRWRGAAPIQRSLMHGDSSTEVCIMQMDEGVDTGDIISRREVIIGREENFTDLQHRLAEVAGDMLEEMISGDMAHINYIKQRENGVIYAKKIEREEEKILWTDSSSDIHNKIRALSYRPGAYFEFNGKRIKVLRSSVRTLSDIDRTLHCGQIIIQKNLPPAIVCGDLNGLEMIELQKEGKRIMSYEEFLRGSVDMKDGISVL